MYTTIQEVAAHAHVSVSTVSRAFKRPDLLSDQTRRRVLDAARKLDFAPTRSAAVLKSGQSLRIALLVSEPINSWFNASILEGLNNICNPAGYDIFICQIQTKEERKRFFSTLPLRRNADAVIVTSFDIEDEEVSRLQTMNVPLIGINSSRSEHFNAAINIDDTQGGMLIARHLLSLGHTDIAYIVTDMNSSSLHYSAQQRVTAFLNNCHAAKIDPTLIHIPLASRQVQSAVTQLLSLPEMPTAIACQEDRIAVPLTFELQRSGIQVPQEVSITGFDDSTYADSIGLTTIRQDPVLLGKEAGRKTLALIDGNNLDNPFQTFPAQLIIRSSTGSVRNLS